MLGGSRPHGGFRGGLMAGATRIDPYKNFRFRVEIQGFQQAALRECSGLGSRIEVIE